MHTREGGGINSQEVTNLTNNWTFQSPLVSGSFGEGNKDIEMMGLEETAVEELEAEFDQFEAGSAPNPHDMNEHVGQLPRKTTMAQLHEVYDLEEIVTI